MFYKFLHICLVLCVAGKASSSALTKGPLECEHFNPNKCDEKNACNTTVLKCEVNSPSEKSGCVVVWSTDSKGDVKFLYKGCLSNTYNNGCNQRECIDYSLTRKNNDTNVCCCDESLCNAGQKWIPTTTKATGIEVPKQNENKENVILVIVACTIAIVVLCIIFIVVFLFYKRKKQGMFNKIPTIEPEVTNSSPCLAFRPIHLLQLKARGRFGAVWHGQLKTDDVAVKIFPMHEKESWMTEQEIYKLPRMNHPNILEFIGAEKHVEKMPHEFWLITAYQSYGSLCDYLKAHTLTWAEFCKIAESMVRGLMHLHEELLPTKTEELKPAIAHRDFKSKNVLLKSDLTACIADFGLAMIFQPGKPCGDTHGQVGTRRYMAPEVLEGAINFTRDAFLRIDVYACGLVIWEMVSRCDAHGGVVEEFTYPFEAELGLHPTLEQMQENVVSKKLRPKIHNHWRSHPGLNAICDTMEECWDHDAEARLSSSCVMERISQHTRYPTTKLLIETNTNKTIKSSSDSL